VINAGKTAKGAPREVADVMQPKLDEIARAREGWGFNRHDTPSNGSGFTGIEGGPTLWVGPDGVIYEGRIAGQPLIDLLTGTKPPSQIPGLTPVR
jgi:hypothetical protein